MQTDYNESDKPDLIGLENAIRQATLEAQQREQESEAVQVEAIQ